MSIFFMVILGERTWWLLSHSPAISFTFSKLQGTKELNYVLILADTTFTLPRYNVVATTVCNAHLRAVSIRQGLQREIKNTVLKRLACNCLISARLSTSYMRQTGKRLEIFLIQWLGNQTPGYRVICQLYENFER